MKICELFRKHPDYQASVILWTIVLGVIAAVAITFACIEVFDDEYILTMASAATTLSLAAAVLILNLLSGAAIWHKKQIKTL